MALTKEKLKFLKNLPSLELACIIICIYYNLRMCISIYIYKEKTTKNYLWFIYFVCVF